MSNKINTLYEFGNFRLDTKERFLFRGEETVFLAPKVFDTLELLVERHGKVVTKDELLEEIWADSFVEEGNLTQNIYVLRKTLGKDFIETIPRRGYRFNSEVSLVERSENADWQNGEEFLVKRTRTSVLAKETIEESSEPIDQKKTPNNPTPKKKSRILLVSLCVGLFSAVTLSLFGYWFVKSPTANTSQNSTNQPEFRVLTDTGNLINTAVSPDGKFLALIKREKNLERTLWLEDIELGQEIKLDVSENFYLNALSFSSDGKNIYLFTRPAMNQSGEIHVIDRFGGNLRLLAKDVWSGAGFSSNDKLMTFIRKNPATNDYHLIIKNLENDDERILKTQKFPDSFDQRYNSPVFSPDNKKILAVAQPQRTFVSTLLVIDAENGTTKKLETPRLRTIFQALYKNEDEIILTAREGRKFPQIYKLFISSGEIQRITNDLNAYIKISIAKDGKTLTSTKAKRLANLWFVPDADTKKAKQLTFGSDKRDGIHGLNTLPNGKIIYVSLADNNRDFWTADPPTGELKQLTKDRGDANEHPFVAPKSNYIYYDSLENAKRNVYRMDFDGQNNLEITSDENANDLFPVVSNDESIVYFIRQTKGVSAIWKKDLPDGTPEKLEVSDKITPVGFLKISPDGKYLLFRQGTKSSSSSVPAKTYQVGVIPTENPKAEPTLVDIPSMNIVVRWANTSDALNYFDKTKEGVVIWRKEVFSQEKRRQIAELPNMDIYNFSWFSNGKDLVVSQGKSMDDAVLIENF